MSGALYWRKWYTNRHKAIWNNYEVCEVCVCLATKRRKYCWKFQFSHGKTNFLCLGHIDNWNHSLKGIIWNRVDVSWKTYDLDVLWMRMMNDRFRKGPYVSVWWHLLTLVIQWNTDVSACFRTVAGQRKATCHIEKLSLQPKVVLLKHASLDISSFMLFRNTFGEIRFYIYNMPAPVYMSKKGVRSLVHIYIQFTGNHIKSLI